MNTQSVLAGRHLETLGARVAAADHVARIHVAEHVCRSFGGVRACAAIPHVVHGAPKRQLVHSHWNKMLQHMVPVCLSTC